MAGPSARRCAVERRWPCNRAAQALPLALLLLACAMTAEVAATSCSPMPGFTVAADADNNGLDATQILGPATRCQANPSWAWSTSQAATLCSNDPRCVAFSTSGTRSVNGVTYPSYICLRMMGVAASANVSSVGTCYYTKGGNTGMVYWTTPASWATFPTYMPPSLTVYTADATNIDTQLWSEEFNDPNGSGPNPNTWSWQIGDGTNEGLPAGWGNSEKQCYADNNSGEQWPNGTSIQYARQADGSLVITTLYKQGRFCWNNPSSNSYTDWASARLNTRNKVGFVPTINAGIRAEAMIKVPLADGIWPAFWMMPEPNTSYTYSNMWCTSGEIDIMEHANVSTKFTGAVHFGGPDFASCKYTANSAQTQSLSTAADWHRFAVVWTLDYIAWERDGWETYRVPRSAWSTGFNAQNLPGEPFNAPFYILLNQAVGGSYGQVAPSGVTDYTAYQYAIDWIRVTSVRPTAAVSRRRLRQ